MSKNENKPVLIDTECLVDRNEVAALLGVGPTAVSNYIARTSEKHAPFPEPVVTRSLGRCRLFDVFDVVDWHCETFPSRSDVWNGDVVQMLRDLREGA